MRNVRAEDSLLEDVLQTGTAATFRQMIGRLCWTCYLEYIADERDATILCVASFTGFFDTLAHDDLRSKPIPVHNPRFRCHVRKTNP